MKVQPILPDRLYHVYNRGNNKEDIFTEEDNYRYFKNLIKRHLLPVCDIYSYCFLKNHFHLVLKTKETDVNLSRSFANLFNAYSKGFNKRNNRVGSLFQKNFKRVLVEDERYFKQLILYVNQNPEKHGFGDFKKYVYSSYNELVDGQSDLIDTDFVYKLFSDKKAFLELINKRFENLEE